MSKFPMRVITYEDKVLFPSEEGFVLNSKYDNKLVVPVCTLEQYIWEDHINWPDKVAMVCAITGRKYTYRQLRKACSALAFSLQSRFNLQSEDVVAIVLPNIPEYGIATLGSLEAGCTLTLINPAYKPSEMANQLIKCRAKLIFTLEELGETVQKAVQSIRQYSPIVLISTESGSQPVRKGNFINFWDMIKEDGTPKSYKFSVENVAFLAASSGTTGLPKLVKLTHFNLIANVVISNAVVGPNDEQLASTQDNQECIPCILPFFHIMGFVNTLMTKIRLGFRLVTIPKFHPDVFLNTLIKHKCTFLTLVPPLIIFLSNYAKATPEHFKNVKVVGSGAALLSAGDIDKFLKKAPHVIILQGYGMTESASVAVRQSRGDKNYKSVGSPMPGTQLKIVALNDEKMIGLGPNQTGEIFLRGPHIMKSYLNNKKATKETLVKNNWLRTGDIGHYDEQGYVYITDRLKELIKVKGFQVAPAELEAILRSHPEVVDVAVIGVPDQRSGEIPRAFVVRREGSNVNEKSIQDFVDSKVTKFKRLAGGVVFMDAIPKSPSGKILRRVLKAKYLKNKL